MTGRPKKEFSPIFRGISIKDNSDLEYPTMNIEIKCPICGSNHVGFNGTQKRKKSFVETFICENPNCKSKESTRFGKQFVINTSYDFLKLIHSILNDIISDLMVKNASKVFIAEKYGISSQIICYISEKLEKSAQKSSELPELVQEKQKDAAIAIDETFLKINGKTVYIILATGYLDGKVLGALVSEHRTEEKMRQVFDEAERNTTNPIEVVTCDAWNATRSMVKNLNRSITVVIHKHKKPYDRAIIQRFEYEESTRFITEIGIKTDFFKKKRKREYYYRSFTESTAIKPKGKRGRPKGTKNGQGKKKKKMPKKKRGRKGLFTVFLAGTRKYARIDPYRNSIRLIKQTNTAAQTAMRNAMDLFCGMCVQNNIAESINSLLRLHFRFSGPKTLQGIEILVRCFLFYHNFPELLKMVQLDYKPQGEFLNLTTSIGKLAPILRM